MTFQQYLEELQEPAKDSKWSEGHFGQKSHVVPPLTFPKASLVSSLWVVICMTEGRDHPCSVVSGFPCPTQASAGGTAGQLPPIGLGFLNTLVEGPPRPPPHTETHTHTLTFP